MITVGLGHPNTLEKRSRQKKRVKIGRTGALIRRPRPGVGKGARRSGAQKKTAMASSLPTLFRPRRLRKRKGRSGVNSDARRPRSPLGKKPLTCIFEARAEGRRGGQILGDMKVRQIQSLSLAAGQAGLNRIKGESIKNPR